MEWLAQQNLIRWFDFYLALAFVISTVLRIHQYFSILRVLWAFPQRWPRLMMLLKEHRHLLVSWATLRSLAFTLGLLLTNTILRRTLLEDGSDLSVGMLGQYWLAIPFVLLTGVAMVCYDIWGVIAVGEVNRNELEGYFDQAEYWLRSWAAPALQIVTFGYVNPRLMVAQEVRTALTGATQSINGTLWWMTVQAALRIAFGLSLWLTFAWSQW